MHDAHLKAYSLQNNLIEITISNGKLAISSNEAEELLDTKVAEIYFYQN